MDRPQKYVGDSLTELMHVVMPADLNGSDRLFGGNFVKWIDETAFITARRHCGRVITTVSIDNLRFFKPIFKEQLVVLVGRVTFVGNTSMEVRVDSYLEYVSGERERINTAFLTQVALDADGRPTQVPGLILTSPEEEADFEAGRRRKEMRNTLAKGLYD